MTKVEIINMVANHYNKHNRAEEHGGCRYITNDGKMCAVGMCMTDEALEDFKYSFSGVFGIQEMIKSESIDSVLKDEFRGHSTSFWTDMQMLHDEAAYWDEEGLSCRGIEKYVKLKEKYHGK